MSLLMDPSLLQHLKQPGPAKGIKYGMIIIMLQLSIILSLSLPLFLSSTDAYIQKQHKLTFPWSIR